MAIRVLRASRHNGEFKVLTGRCPRCNGSIFLDTARCPGCGWLVENDRVLNAFGKKTWDLDAKL